MVGLLLALAGLAGLPVRAASLILTNLPALDQKGWINGAYLEFGNTNAGSGLLNPFLRVQANTTEEGYNSSGASVMAAVKTGTWTHDIQLRDILTTNILGTNYYKFAVDLNQSGSSTFISLDKLELWVSTTPVTPANATNNLLSQATLMFDMDLGDDANEVLLDAANAPGSGYADYVMLVPFGALGAKGTNYLHLFTRFGAKAGIWQSNGGFEEFAAFTNPDTALGSIADLVWLDANANGVKETGESGIASVRVYLDLDQDGAWDPINEPAALTDAGGLYAIGSLVAGTYLARVDTSTLPSNLVPTFDLDGTNTLHRAGASLAAGQARTDVDFGYATLDFGDLADGAAGTGTGDYQTLLQNDGPRHYLSGDLRIGDAVDADANGQPRATPSTTGDDDTGSTPDDEDGIASFPILQPGTSGTITVSVHNPAGGTGAATLYGFFDWNNDGDFLDADETGSIAVPDATTGSVNLPYSVPVTAVTGAGLGFRLRLTTTSLTGATAALGLAADGEVEDYAITVTAASGPTFALVTDLAARQIGARTMVEWQTSYEAGSIAFRLLRHDPRTDAWKAVGTEPLPASGSPLGATYRVLDLEARAGQTSTYAVEELDDTGARHFYGPFAVVVAVGPDSGPNLPAIDPHDRVASTAGSRSGSGSSPVAVTARPGLPAPVVPGNPPGSSTPGPSLAAYIKIPASADGVHFVATIELMKVTGRPEAFWRDLFQRQGVGLSLEGLPVPMLLAENAAGIFFYATASDSLLSTHRCYWLSGQANVPPGRVEGVAPKEPGSLPHRARIAVEENRLPVTTLSSDPSLDYWMWKRLGGFAAADAEARFTLTTPDVQASGLDGTARLTVGLHGADAGTRGVTASLVNAFGTAEVGNLVWSGKTPASLEAAFDAALLAPGDNTLVLRAARAQDGAAGLSYLDRYELSYPATPRAVAGRVRLEAEASGVYGVAGFTRPDVTVFDITDPARPAVLTGVAVEATGAEWSAHFVGQAGHRYFAFEPAGTVAVTGLATALRPSLEFSRNRADYVIIAPAALAAPARDLAAYRKGQGLVALMLTLEQVADEFGGGIASPAAIRRFLRTAVTRWSGPPRYLVLFGDGTYDYRDLAGAHDNQVPTDMLPTAWGLFASDALGGDVDGDGRVEVSIGRLPVRTVEQGNAMVAKIRAQEERLGYSPRRALLVADQPDTAGAYTAAAETIRGLLEPAFVTETVYRAELPGPTTVQRRILAALAGDLDLLSYAGHGGHDRLGVGGYLRTSDIAGLTGTGRRLPIVTAMTCAVGNFAVPGNDPLGERLVLAPDGGAIAVWSPSGLSLDRHAQVLNRNFARRLAEAEPGARLGDLIRASMQAYRDEGGPMEFLAIYNLLGDPGSRVR